MSKFILWGAIVNAVAVLIGSIIGLIAKRGMSGGKENGFGSRLSKALMMGVGLAVFVIGIDGAIETTNALIMIISLILGVIVGELIDIDKWIGVLGERVERGFHGKCGNVAQGFVTASLVFCVGSLSIIGPLNSGILGDHSVQYTKSILDFVSSIVFASSLGLGVGLSSLFILVFQGGITLLADLISPLLSSVVICEMSAVGSLLVIAVGLNLMGLTKIKVMNYMPAIFMPMAVVPLYNFIASI